MLHLDADWYESTKVALEALWDRVSPGRIVQLDDYTVWQGAGTRSRSSLPPGGISNRRKRTVVGGALRLEKA